MGLTIRPASPFPAGSVEEGEVDFLDPLVVQHGLDYYAFRLPVGEGNTPERAKFGQDPGKSPAQRPGYGLVTGDGNSHPVPGDGDERIFIGGVHFGPIGLENVKGTGAVGIPGDNAGRVLGGLFWGSCYRRFRSGQQNSAIGTGQRGQEQNRA
jgi:hypothetical protein